MFIRFPKLFFLSILFCLSLLLFNSCKKDPSIPIEGFVQDDSVITVLTCKPCNGYKELCNKKYDEIVYVTTHNAYNSKSGNVNYLFPNQDYRISVQLKDGVRALMIDVHPYDGNDSAYLNKPYVSHGSSLTGSEPLINVLDEIKQFLDTNPREIVTIILECYVSSSDISSAMEEAGLTDYLFTHHAGTPWETLKEIIEGGKRLIVFSDVNDAGNFSWYHYLWDYCVETGYSAQSKDELSCDFNRGDSSNSLFILNHFISESILSGNGLFSNDGEINYNPFLINRVKLCSDIHKKLPNFLTVDFYSKGNVFEAAKELNGVK